MNSKIGPAVVKHFGFSLPACSRRAAVATRLKLWLENKMGMSQSELLGWTHETVDHFFRLPANDDDDEDLIGNRASNLCQCQKIDEGERLPASFDCLVKATRQTIDAALVGNFSSLRESVKSSLGGG